MDGGIDGIAEEGSRKGFSLMFLNPFVIKLFHIFEFITVFCFLSN